MKLNIETVKIITLELSEEEILWLKGYLQNSFVEEDTYNNEMRTRFFNLLNINFK